MRKRREEHVDFFIIVSGVTNERKVQWNGHEGTSRKWPVLCGRIISLELLNYFQLDLIQAVSDWWKQVSHAARINPRRLLSSSCWMQRCQFLLRSAWIFMMWTLIVVSINQIELCFVEMVENRGVGSGIDVEALLPICVEFQLICRTNTGNLKSEWKEKVAESKSRRKVRAAKKVKARKSKSGTNKCHFPCDFQWAAPTEPTAPHALPFWATGGWRVAGENIREQKEWLKMGPGMGGGGW